MSGHKGELWALGAVVSWTFTALFFEAAGHRIGSLVVNIVRLFLASVLFAVAMLLLRGQPLPLGTPGAAWGWLALSALFGFVVGDGGLFRAFLVLGARRASTIMSLVPPLTALGGFVFLAESLHALECAGMALTLTGVVLVVFDRGPDPNAPRHATPGGVCLGLLGAFGQAVGLVFSKRGMLAGVDAFGATQIRVLCGAFFFSLLFTILRGWPRVREGIRDRRALAFTLAGAICGPFIGVSCSLFAIQATEAAVAATIMALTPVMMIPAVLVLGRERIHARGYVGAILAVGGVALLFLR